MIQSIFILVCSLIAVMKGASLSTTYAIRLAEGFRLSKYTVGFIVIAIISILPEAFISINAALTDVPSFALVFSLDQMLPTLRLSSHLLHSYHEDH